MISNNVVEFSAKVSNVHDYKDRKYVLYVNPGQYRIPGPLNIGNGARNVVIRGITGNPEDVRVIGGGFNNRSGIAELLTLANCSNITLAHMTFESAYANGVKMQGGTNAEHIYIYNCHFNNIGQRAIKGTSGGTHDYDRVVYGEVKYCYIMCDSIHPAGYDDGFGGNYIGGIDCMGLNHFGFRYNIFETIRGTSSGARGAIFLWHMSRDCIVENNIFLNCDMAIAFGNPAGSNNMTDGIMRNNFISGGAGRRIIDIVSTQNTKMYNNTLYVPSSATQTINLEGNTSLKIKNNIIKGNIHHYSGEAPETAGNIFSVSAGWFKNTISADLHLASAVSQLVNRGVSLPEITNDIDDCPRVGNPDIGADEYGQDNCALAGIQADPHDMFKNRINILPFPNPFSTSVDIKLVRSSLCVVRSETADIEIFDIRGRLISNIPRTTNYEPRTTYRWHAQDNPAGIYIIRLKAGEKEAVTRITLKK
jgi:hypothetical protein